MFLFLFLSLHFFFKKRIQWNSNWKILKKEWKRNLYLSHYNNFPAILSLNYDHHSLQLGEAQTLPSLPSNTHQINQSINYLFINTTQSIKKETLKLKKIKHYLISLNSLFFYCQVLSLDFSNSKLSQNKKSWISFYGLINCGIERKGK